MERTWKQISSRERIRTRYFPDVVLRAHDGAKLRLYEDVVKDRIVTFNFMYTRCSGICVPVTQNLCKVQSFLSPRVGKDIFMWSFSLKPKEDTPEALAAYAKQHGIGPGWRLLTGAPKDLERVRRSLGFVDPDPTRDADLANHLGMVRYGNEPLELWSACPGESDAESLAKSIVELDWPASRQNVITVRSLSVPAPARETLAPAAANSRP